MAGERWARRRDGEIVELHVTRREADRGGLPVAQDQAMPDVWGGRRDLAPRLGRQAVSDVGLHWVL